MPTPLLVCGKSHDEVKRAVADTLTVIQAALDKKECSDISCVTRFLAAEEILKRRLLTRLVRCPGNCLECEQ